MISDREWQNVFLSYWFSYLTWENFDFNPWHILLIFHFILQLMLAKNKKLSCQKNLCERSCVARFPTTSAPLVSLDSELLEDQNIKNQRLQWWNRGFLTGAIFRPLSTNKSFFFFLLTNQLTRAICGIFFINTLIIA